MATTKRASVSRIGVSINPNSPKKQTADTVNKLVAQVLGRAGCEGCGRIAYIDIGFLDGSRPGYGKTRRYFNGCHYKIKPDLPPNAKLIHPLGVGFPYFATLPADLYRSDLVAFVEITPETLCRQRATGTYGPRLKSSLTVWQRRKKLAPVCRLWSMAWNCRSALLTG